MRRVAYYKGCLASLSAKELDISTQALSPKVGLELVELEAVTCCGAGDIHEAEPDYYLHLNARILAYAEATGCDTLMTVCNVCTLNLRQANHQLQGDEALRERVNTNLAKSACREYNGTVDVRHFLWLVAEGEGYELLKAAAHKGLKGLKIAPFYGCQILRPSKLLGFEDPDRPSSLERIIEACGGEAIDYPAKIKCCGFPIIQAREETALGELIQPIEQAKEAGADAIVTPCPLCHLSLDAWQSKLKTQTGKDFQMPILHLSQLIGVAAGLRGVGAPVQAPRRLRRARRREAQPSRARRSASSPRRGCARPGSPTAGSRPAGCARACSRCRSTGCRRSSTGCGSRTSPTSTSASPSRGSVAVRAGGRSGCASARPDLVCVTGDLLSRPRGEPLLDDGSGAASSPRSPCSGTTTSRTRATRSRSPASSDGLGAGRCSSTSRGRSSSGRSVQIVGLDPRSRRRPRAAPRASSTQTADLRILLCHFPGSPGRARRLELVLAGHMHARPDRAAVSRRQASARPPTARASPRGSTARRHRAPRLARPRARRSCPFASSPGPR